MSGYVTGGVIKDLRQQKGLTQSELAERLGVSDKAVSKWECGKGLPDVSLLQPLAEALSVSVAELLSGQPVVNQNRAGNMLRGKWYVCPLCGNAIHTLCEAVVSCCGITLPVLEAEEADEAHRIVLQRVEDEYYLTVPHEMTKSHYISFLAHVTADRLEFRKLYPEGEAATRFSLRGGGMLYLYCNKHGLMKQKVSR